MAEKLLGTNPEKEKAKGLNVVLRSFYFRHAEKAVAVVGSGSFISNSIISEKGRVESIELGAQLPRPAERGFKVGWSGLDRTFETGQAMTAGYLRGEKRKEFKPGIKKELSLGYLPEQFNKLYIEMSDNGLEKMLEQKRLSKDDFYNLSPTEQAQIAEAVDEPIIREWLENAGSELYRLYPPEQQAAHLAVLAQRDIKMSSLADSDSKFDLFRFTHRTITEPLLMKMIILDNGKKPEKLDDIGGAMGLNDGWELECKTDANGDEEVRLYLYRARRSEKDNPVYEKKEFKIDLAELKRLADLGIKLKQEEYDK